MLYSWYVIYRWYCVRYIQVIFCVLYTGGILCVIYKWYVVYVYQRTKYHLYITHKISPVYNTHNITCIQHTKYHLYITHKISPLYNTQNITCTQHTKYHLYITHNISLVLRITDYRCSFILLNWLINVPLYDLSNCLGKYMLLLLKHKFLGYYLLFVCRCVMLLLFVSCFACSIWQCQLLTLVS
jgi:hypothetical protein